MQAKTYHKKSKSQPSGGNGQTPGSGSPLTVGNAGGSDPLLYLYSNISIGEPTEEAIIGLTSLLSPYHKKAAQTLYLNVSRLIKEAKSLNNVGLLTLTFAENITDNSEASRRFDIFNTNFLLKDPRFGTKITVKEPQVKRGIKNGDSGAWHYHILITLSEDIRTGIDFEAIAKRDYRSANQYLRTLWKDIRKACKLYGFGRPELLPVKSNAEAMGRYIGKYISKGIENRTHEQKGVRLVNYSKGWSRNSPKFAWNTKNSFEWRRKVQLFAKTHGCSDLYQLSEKFGSDWAYKFIDQVINAQDIYIEDRTENWKYQTNGNRIHRKTGELQKEEEYTYKDPIFKRIQENEKNRFHHLWSDAKDDLKGKETYRQKEKRKRKRATEKTQIELLLLREKVALNEAKKLPKAPF